MCNNMFVFQGSLHLSRHVGLFWVFGSGENDLEQIWYTRYGITPCP